MSFIIKSFDVLHDEKCVFEILQGRNRYIWAEVAYGTERNVERLEKRQFKSRFSDATSLVFEEQNTIVSVSQTGVHNLPETTSWTGMQNNKHREFVLQVSSELMFCFFLTRLARDSKLLLTE